MWVVSSFQFIPHPLEQKMRPLNCYILYKLFLGCHYPLVTSFSQQKKRKKRLSLLNESIVINLSFKRD
ncbi:hypothetical protein N665_0365s0014 [Sinapis alba]|nr:hypothetical protein N665_0365s0014 [Sinapis alba]